VGLAIGLNPPAILVIMGFFALGIILAICRICDGLAASSARVRGWIDRLAKKTEKYPQIRGYPFCCQKNLILSAVHYFVPIPRGET
jgi:hypothetical protein